VLQAIVMQPSSSLSLLTSRVTTGTSHLRGRLAHLTTLGLFPTDITTSHNQKLQGHLDRTEQHTAKFELADRRGQQTEAQDGTDNMAQGASRAHPSLLSGRVGDRLGAVDRQETGDVSTVTVAVTNDKEALSAPGAQANAGNNAATLPSLSQSASPVFILNFYQRLPHPLSHPLKELPERDGTHVCVTSQCYLFTYIACLVL